MMRRWVVLVSVSALIAPASALAQDPGGNPFGPLPQTPAPQPAPSQPKPHPVNPDENDDGLGGTAFWLIMGTTALLFVVVGFFITRDMRRSAGTRRKTKRRLRSGTRPAAAAADALATGPSRPTGSQRARAKAQQRAKVRAARKQRRKTR